MKLLVIDVGNTSTAVGLWSDGRVGSVAHFDGADAEGPVAGAPDSRMTRRICRMLTRARGVTALAYVSVVPKRDAAWRAFAAQGGLEFRPVTHRLFARGRFCAGVRLDYPKPQTIGADRLADAAGAVARHGVPTLVMDFGTALTAAVVTRDRVWRGGVIAPGFPLMRDYLFERTAKLPRMRLGSGGAPKIGRSTEEAMRFGALVGYRGMVREIVAQLCQNFRTDFKLVATGGYAQWALAGLDLDFVIDPTLTLFGAGLLAAEGYGKEMRA